MTARTVRARVKQHEGSHDSYFMQVKHKEQGRQLNIHCTSSRRGTRTCAGRRQASIGLHDASRIATGSGVTSDACENKRCYCEAHSIKSNTRREWRKNNNNKMRDTREICIRRIRRPGGRPDERTFQPALPEPKFDICSEKCQCCVPCLLTCRVSSTTAAPPRFKT
jgi:hypothetical protein